MFENIYEYINTTQSERQKHLNLTEECICIGGTSQEFRALLSHLLKVTIPKGSKILLCHACYNAKCSNPKHLYWGTASENCQDTLRAGSRPKTHNWKNKHLLIESGKRMAKNLKSSKGFIWVNNGIKDIRVKKEEIPNGFQKGRLFKMQNQIKCSVTGKFISYS